VEFQTDVAGANALAPNCGYLTTPAVAALLKQRVKFTSTASPIWEGGVLDGNVDGFRAMSSLQVPTANILFGDFSQVVIGEWGMLEIAMNPYANFAAAITGIRAIQTVDVGVRQAGAFSLATAVT
jgi:HK97 family phage major capsid protein